MVYAAELMPERNCRKCTNQQKVRWGCEKRPTEPPVEIDGEKLSRCPNRPLLDFPIFFNEVFTMYRWFGREYLPDRGTWLDQSNIFIQLIEVIEGATSEARKIKDDREAAAKRAMSGVKTK